MREPSFAAAEEQLLATLRAECARLGELLELARREYEVTAEDDFSALFSIVQARQSVLAQIEQHQRDFMRLVGDREASAPVRQQADCVTTLIAQINEQDCATRLRLSEARTLTSQALQRIN